MKRYLLINPFGIGDVLFTTPLIRAIKETYPDSFIGYWCNERVEPILKENPRINKIFALSRGDIKKIFDQSRWQGIVESLNLFRNIKKEHFDICFDFSLDHRYSLTSKFLGIKRRMGFNYKNRVGFLTDKIDINGYSDRHVVEYYLELLRFIGIIPKNDKLEISISEIGKSGVKNLFNYFAIKEEDFVVGIAPGAGGSWGKDAKIKHWSAIKYAQLADKIINELDAKVLILGDEIERPIADIIANAMENKAIDLVGKTTLDELIAAIAKLNILITNDGGPLHIAVAAGVKTVSIFGPVDDMVYGPYPKSQNHIVIKNNISCRPCYQNFRMPICDKDRVCIKNINVEEVFEAVRRLR